MATPSKSDISPKEFLKARRPERFSDTVRAERSHLDRSQLEFILATITSRSQENDFQRFAQRLCERTICPNLVPQTGPTGGGDSKVDSETYPVAEELALLWYVGVTGESARERWAFAVSGKKDWPPKVRSDIEKAVATNRGYTKAFFITNQAVPDRKRAAEEDKLRTTHGLDVRILDRTWILDRVFENRLEDLAVEHLRATTLAHHVAVKGPADTQREQELEEIDRRLTEAVAAGRLGSHLAELAIEAGELARALERPRDEVIGRFRRAEELATKYGTPRLQVEASYQLAWTLFWWFEDYSAFVEQYKRVESAAKDSRNAYDLEELTNLWHCLQSWAEEELPTAGMSLVSVTTTLTSALTRLQGEQDRPSASLQAEAHLAHVGLVMALRERRPFDTVLTALRDILLRSKGLVGFPLEPLIEIVTELGDVITDSPTFDELLETAVSIASTNEWEAQGGRLLLKRGSQLLDQERPVDVISVVGRALTKLYKHETRHDVVRAMFLMGCAYDEIGLPWAARGTLLTAASVATNELWQYGSATPPQAVCYHRLKWVELKLGRLPHTLAWHETEMILRRQLRERQDAPEDDAKDDPSFQMALGRLLLRTEFSNLRSLETLPATLDRLGLPLAADALLFALGHEDRLKEMATSIGEDVEDVARRWSTAEADGPLADHPDLYSSCNVTLTSNILGCRIEVDCENEDCCLEVAESVLAVMESFLSTAAVRRAVAFEPSVTVNVRRSEFAKDPFSFEISEESARPHLEVRCRVLEEPLSPDRQALLKDTIFNLGVMILSHSVRFNDLEADLTALFRDERAGDRATGFASGVGAKGNVFGSSEKSTITAWLDAAGPTYELRRTLPWPGARAGRETPQEPQEPPSPPTGEPAMGESFWATLSHASMATLSPIRIPLWDRAGWHGAVYSWTLNGAEPPVLALMFADSAAGRRIFEEWRKERTIPPIKISIIRGINKSSPFAYSIMLAQDQDAVPPGTRLVVSITRQCRMDSTSPKNLDTFLERATAAGGRYRLAPAYAPRGTTSARMPLDVYAELAVLLQGVRVVHAWEVGVQDLEQVTIAVDDEPIIPASVLDPPIRAVLKRKRERR
jgi:hypothetical protein